MLDQDFFSDDDEGQWAGEGAMLNPLGDDEDVNPDEPERYFRGKRPAQWKYALKRAITDGFKWKLSVCGVSVACLVLACLLIVGLSVAIWFVAWPYINSWDTPPASDLKWGAPPNCTLAPNGDYYLNCYAKKCPNLTGGICVDMFTKTLPRLDALGQRIKTGLLTEAKLDPPKAWKAGSVSQGLAGAALELLHLYDHDAAVGEDEKHELLELAKNLVETAKISYLPSTDMCSFLTGRAGVLAVYINVYRKLAGSDIHGFYNYQATQAIGVLRQYAHECLKDPSEDTALVGGLAGLLQTAQYLEKHVGGDVLPGTMDDAAKRLLAAGAKNPNRVCPYEYFSNGKASLRWSSGLSGVMSVLLRTPSLVNKHAAQLIQGLLCVVDTYQQSDGSMSLSKQTRPKRLRYYEQQPAQLMGATTGWVVAASTALEVFNSSVMNATTKAKLVSSLQSAAQYSWNWGLTPSAGLAYGIDGNIYAQLLAYRQLQDTQHLASALAMTEFLLTHYDGWPMHDNNTLFAGVLGVLALSLDFHNATAPPWNSNFTIPSLS